MKSNPIGWAVLLVSLLFTSTVYAAPISYTGVSSITAADARQGFIAFVNMTTSPGVEGSALEMESTNRESDLWRSSLGFTAEFTLKQPIYNGYWGLALVGGGLNDRFTVLDDFGDPLDVDVQRDIVALRGSYGLSFPIDEHLKIRPFATLVLSRSKSEVTTSGNLISQQLEDEDSIFSEFSVEAASGVGSVDVLYSDWQENYAVEFFGRYNVMYTDTFSIDNPVLDTWAWSQSIFAKGTLSGPTNWHFQNRNWRWNTYFSHNNYLDQSKSALGFRYLNEVGVGLDWDMHVKPLDWFGWRYFGIRAGYSFGDNVTGFNVGLVAR